MACFVLDGIRIKCIMGDMESELEVTDPKGEGYISGKAAANIMDNIPLINIQPFGMCKSLQNPAVAGATSLCLGVLQPQPCMPVITDKWKNGTDPKIYIRGEPALMDDAELKCEYQGIIEVAEEFTAPRTGAEDLLVDETFFGQYPDRGPGTRYINNKGQLLYQARDGAAGRVLIVLDADLLHARLKKAKANSTLNNPNNTEILSTGKTGEQYCCLMHPRISRNWNFRNGYDIGYNEKMDRDKYYRQNTTNTAGSSYGNDGPDIVGIIDLIRGKEVSDLTNDYIDERAGFEAGIGDKDNGRIDALNPTARITGPALLTI